MVIGASTSCLYPMLTENAVNMVLSMGIRDIEIFFNTSSELKSGYISKLKRLVRSYGGKVHSIHPYSSMMESFMFFSDYERRFTDMIDEYKRYFEAAKTLDADIIVIHGDKLPARLPDEKYFERFARIIECGKQFGVCVAQENVNLHRSQNIDFLCAMKEWIGDDLKFVFDVKQAVRAGFDPYEFARRLGNSIAHVHVNDNDAEHTCLLPGNGVMDFARLKSILDENGCDPSWVIEVYRRNFGEPQEVARAVQWLKGIVNI